MTMKRYALVLVRGSDTAEQMCQYLPDNYKKIGYAPHDPEAQDIRNLGPCMVIQGEDVAGWTLDDYVIPRLASGLIGASEIDLSHPVLKTIVE